MKDRPIEHLNNLLQKIIQKHNPSVVEQKLIDSMTCFLGDHPDYHIWSDMIDTGNCFKIDLGCNNRKDVNQMIMAFLKQFREIIKKHPGSTLAWRKPPFICLEGGYRLSAIFGVK